VPELHPTLDRRHLTLRDFRRADGKPFGPGQGERVEPDDLIMLWRVVHLDTGREVFRTESPEFNRFHCPGDGKAMIQIVMRKGQLIFDMNCWEIPQP
jgi:hypothetical protein